MAEFTKVAVLVKYNERYEVYDLGLEELVASMTVLYEGKSTVGHSHSDAEEVCIFIEGKGEIQLADYHGEDVASGDTVMIPRGVFHRVFNKGDRALTFMCVFEKHVGRGK